MSEKRRLFLLKGKFFISLNMPFPHQMKRKIGKIKVEINFIKSTIKLILLINIMITIKYAETVK